MNGKFIINDSIPLNKNQWNSYDVDNGIPNTLTYKLPINKEYLELSIENFKNTLFYSTNINLIANVPFIINHNLSLTNENDIIIQLYNNNNLIDVNIEIVNNNIIQITSNIDLNSTHLIIIAKK